MGKGIPAREPDALRDLISQMPQQLFDGYMNDAEFHGLVRHLAEGKLSYPQALEEMVKYYLGIRKIERDKAIDKAMKEPHLPMCIGS
ncbi:hypothetical protein DBR45_23245 [Pseudomonas sp. HMWF031]|nr:hypothetical protein DBR45_23245 [Pseudomonas sp. HMWF031]